MTDDDLRSVYRDVDAFLARERSNVEPVSATEARKVKQLFARGRISGGVCAICGKSVLHAHEVS